MSAITLDTTGGGGGVRQMGQQSSGYGPVGFELSGAGQTIA